MNDQNEYTLTLRMGDVAVHVQMGDTVYNLSPTLNNERRFTDAEKHMLTGMLRSALAMVQEDPDA